MTGIGVWLLAAVLLAWGSSAWAGSSAKGSATALFLGIGPGARAAALGEAYTAVVDEASAIYWNPAALSRIEKRSLHLMHANYLGAADFDYLAFGHNLGRYGAWGLGVQSFGAKGIAQTDIAGVSGGTFSTEDTAFSVGYALSASSGAWAGAALGVVAKTISSRVATTAHANALDLGALSPAFLGDRLRLALTVSNLGSKLRYDRSSERLPQITRVGAAFRPAKRWLASVDLAVPVYDAPYISVGGEALLGSAEGVQAAARAGFNSSATQDVTGFSGVSFGLGLTAGGWNLDYGIVPFGSLGLAHRFSLGVKF